MSEFVKELNFDCDTFSGMKRDMNFVLQRLIGNMQEKGCQNGTLTLKLDGQKRKICHIAPVSRRGFFFYCGASP